MAIDLNRLRIVQLNRPYLIREICLRLKDMKKQHQFATRAIHAGQEPDPSTGAIMTPIYATSTYVQESPGKHKGYDYARSINPTRLAYERCIADLESGTRGFAFASGLAAMSTALEVLESG